MFSKLLYMINISSYNKEQLKLCQPFHGVKGGGGAKTALSSTFSCNCKGKKLKFGEVGEIIPRGPQ